MHIDYSGLCSLLIAFCAWEYVHREEIKRLKAIISSQGKATDYP